MNSLNGATQPLHSVVGKALKQSFQVKRVEGGWGVGKEGSLIRGKEEGENSEGGMN